MTVRERLLIPACIAAITVLAWIYLLHLDGQMSASMDYDRQMAAMGMAASGQWTAADGFLNLAMWVVMMVGMMAGSVTPMLQLFAGTQAAPGQPRTSQEVLAFGLGYLLIWSAFSAVATLGAVGAPQRGAAHSGDEDLEPVAWRWNSGGSRNLSTHPVEG